MAFISIQIFFFLLVVFIYLFLEISSEYGFKNGSEFLIKLIDKIFNNQLGNWAVHGEQKFSIKVVSIKKYIG